MSIDIKGTSNRPIAGTDSGRTRAATGNQGHSSASSASSASGADTLSITNSASRLQELSAQIASLPVEDAQHVADIQRSIASGNYQFEPEDAAENLLTQERNFAANTGQE